MKPEIKQMVEQAKADLEDLDEQELVARIAMNEAHKTWETLRVQRELKIQRLRLLINAVLEQE